MLVLAEVFFVAEFGDEVAVLVRIQEILVGVRVRGVEFVLLNEGNVAFFLTVCVCESVC